MTTELRYAVAWRYVSWPAGRERQGTPWRNRTDAEIQAQVMSGPVRHGRRVFRRTSRVIEVAVEVAP